MKVEKVELKDRTFIPFQVVITVESEEEHKKLKHEISNLDSDVRRGLSLRNSFETLRNMLHEITKHTK